MALGVWRIDYPASGPRSRKPGVLSRSERRPWDLMATAPQSFAKTSSGSAKFQKHGATRCEDEICEMNHAGWPMASDADGTRDG
jgi:hypothetical protein